MTDKALLIDVDSKIPNLALMHISTWKKQLGYEVGFDVIDPDEVWASCVFKWNAHNTDGLRFFYPNAKLNIGGSGIDIKNNLPKEVDLLMPDYSLYPEWDSDIGFTTRGCDRGCYFCIVTKKEGKFHIHQHPSEFHNPNHKKITFLDNNILWDKDWFFEVTDWCIKNKMKVDFNQGLDIRLMDMDIARRIKQLKYFNHWHFAFDKMEYKDDVLRGIEMLNRAGVSVRNNTNWYVYLHNDDQFEDALERCQILREHKAIPYVMLNRDAEKTQRITDLKRWTRPQIFFTTDWENYKSGVRKSQ